MKLSLVHLIFLLSMLCISNAYSEEFHVYISPEIGTGHINVNDSYTPDGFNADGDVVQTAIQAGVIYDKWVVLANYSIAGTDEFLRKNDHFELIETGLQAGYQVDLIGPMKFIPSVGISSWELAVDNENETSEDDFQDSSGVDPYVKLILGFDFSRVVGVSFSYTYGDYDFGKSEIFKTGVDIHFRW